MLVDHQPQTQTERLVLFVSLTTKPCLLPGFYLISPSEFERFSLSTRHVVEPRSLVEVPLYSASSAQHRSQPDGVNRSPHCRISHFPVATACRLSVFIDFVSTSLGMLEKAARTQVRDLQDENATLQHACTSLWADAICVHTHTRVVADICLLPVVFQRVQLDVLWSMLC